MSAATLQRDYTKISMLNQVAYLSLSFQSAEIFYHFLYSAQFPSNVLEKNAQKTNVCLCCKSVSFLFSIRNGFFPPKTFLNRGLGSNLTPSPLHLNSHYLACGRCPNFVWAIQIIRDTQRGPNKNGDSQKLDSTFHTLSQIKLFLTVLGRLSSCKRLPKN